MSARDEHDPVEATAIDSVKQGNANAYDYLVSKYLRRVVSVAWNIVRNATDAEDLAQEAFVRAYETIGRFKSGERFGPWIYRIVTNLSLDLMKHRSRVRFEDLSATSETPRRDSADLAASSHQIAERIDEALETLPDMQRIVARLYLIEQFEHEEIASMTGLAEGTVRSHLSLARGKLKQQLSDLYE